MPLKNLQNTIRALQAFDLRSNVIDIINEYEWYVDALLRLQLAEGKDFEGKPVTIYGRDYYKDRTVFDKEHGKYPPLGKVTDRITNFLTGAFYAALKTIAQGTVFKTESDVEYFEKILERSGDRIMKLNKAHRNEFVQEIIIPELRKRFKALKGGV